MLKCTFQLFTTAIVNMSGRSLEGIRQTLTSGSHGTKLHLSHGHPSSFFLLTPTPMRVLYAAFKVALCILCVQFVFHGFTLAFVCAWVAFYFIALFVVVLLM